MTNQNTTINGYRIYTNDILTETEYETVDRTLSERLFTFPWKPTQKTKKITRQVPSTNIIVNEEDRCMVMHPEMQKLLEQEIEKNQPPQFAWHQTFGVPIK